MDKVIAKGSKVSLSYEGKLENGEVFDSSSHGDHEHPLDFVAGTGQMIKGFDDAVIGMKEGEEKEFSIESKEAYGEWKEELQREIPKSSIKFNGEPKVGMALAIQTPQGGQISLKITKVSDENITVDMNHPLAGKKLIFKIKILKIE